MKLRLIFLLVLLVGCKSQQSTSSEKTTVTDSTVVKFTPVDTLVSFPADSVRIVTSVNSLSEIPVIKKGKRATLSISRLGEIITADCRAEELEAEIRLLNKEIERFRKVITDKSETVTVPERFVPWTVKYLAWIGGIFLLFHGIKLILKFYNPFSR